MKKALNFLWLAFLCIFPVSALIERSEMEFKDVSSDHKR